jgi:hypothetical protein
MRTMWVGWALDDIRDAAEAEGQTALDCLGVPEMKLVETLPYYGAFSDYPAHIAGCADCRRDDRDDCVEGETLRAVARIGVEEQHRIAESN